MTNKQFVDDRYDHITNELEQIQKCAGMYISTKGTEGALHLFKEIVGNSIDESNNVNSPCDEIDIYFDQEYQHFIVRDNGRGIKFDKMKEFCTEKHTSTKYDRQNNYYSAGCYGVGMKVTNAYSHVFTMESIRDGFSKTIKFLDCQCEEFEPVKAGNDEHGLVINFIPSTDMLGPVAVTEDMCLEWLRHMSYIMPKHLTIHAYMMEGDCNKIKYNRIFKHAGLVENIKYLSPSKLEFDPIDISYKESDEGGSLQLDMSFSYDKAVEEEVTDSYCNNVWTFEGGYHLNTCRSAVCDFMVKAARQADPDAKYTVTANDVRKGLVMVVNCNWGLATLAGQHKSSVTSKEIDEIGRKGVSAAIAEFFSTNNALLNKLISYYRQMAKIRMMATDMKGLKPPKTMTIYDESEIARYTPLSDSNKKGYRELIITEGESAAGAILGARDPSFQAVYHTQGVMKNTTEGKLADILKSEIPRDLARILGVEPGKDFNINNLKWDKIIFLQDADADGKNIRSLASTYLILWLPQLITEGRLYAGMPPLYVFSDTTVKKYGMKKNFYYDKKEFGLVYNDIVARNIEFYIYDEDDNPIPQNRSETVAFLTKNRRYLEYLTVLAGTHEACDSRIIEHVCNAIMNFGIDTPAMVEYLKQVLPEMKYDSVDKSLVGSFEGEEYGLNIDNGFLIFAKDFMPVFEQNPSMYVAYRNKNKSSDDPIHKTTIGEFFKEITNSYNIKAEQRFKGLGEASAKLLFTTSLNPKTRRLIRLTMEDRERVLEDVMMLHKKGDKYAEARRQLLANADITDDDIDN